MAWSFTYLFRLPSVKGRPKKDGSVSDKGLLYRAIESLYAPVLFTFPVRLAVILVFLAWFCLSIAVAPKIDVGLEQEISMPDDSHVAKYFSAIFDYLSIGPPVYFVVKGGSGLNYSDPNVQDILRLGDFPYSLATQIFSASKVSNLTFIAKPTQSWIDDFDDWANTAKCCRYQVWSGDYCSSSNTDGE